MERYDSYKDSGVDWLGEIPAHWSLEKAKFLWKEIEDRSLKGQEELLSVSQYSGVVPKSDESRSESLEDYKKCRPNDLVINIMLAWMGGLGISDYDGLVSPAYCVYRQTQQHNPKYLGHLYRTPLYLAAFARCSKGIVPSRWRMYTEDFGQILSLLPPRNDQDRIVAFLDQKTAEIDAAIAKKERLIELLQEQKNILINQAVTRGLNPDVPLRDSGVEWIGQIPANWKCAQLKRTWTVLDCKHVTVPFVEDGIPLASVMEAQSFELDLTKAQRTTEKYWLRLIEGGRQPESGDLIYCRNTSVGSAAHVSVNQKMAMGQDVCLIRSKRQSGRFLNYFLRSNAMKVQLEKTLVGSTFKRINVSDVKSLMTLVPPKVEQDSIVQHIAGIEVKVDGVIDLIRSEIEQIKQMRTTLIASAVTGKIKV